ncbi:sugar nucleotide-binding protein [Bifidobacterium porcinum]|uniref:sugar nucleotide-binding protein n=1 Tax=Bifidobacterium porcinum TaxID=212365 RepID=UPI0023A9D3FB|nr:sugar nucleotide-binding protein [Bifidobacterium porcinum]
MAECPRHYILRTSWVVEDGRNFVKTMEALTDRVADPDDTARPRDRRGRPAGSVHVHEGPRAGDSSTCSMPGCPTAPTTAWASAPCGRGRTSRRPYSISPTATATKPFP